MKTAYQYIRISNDDQSNFSISGQQKMNNDFAERNGIVITKTFIDDGYSAKDFNRPNWKILERELHQNKDKVDFLIVTKYDRLIRNVIEGISFIEKMEGKWGVAFLSVMENFFIDPHSPYFFKMRIDLLVQAEMERREGIRRTKMGIWSAQTQGRFVSKAPFGYINVNPEKGNKGRKSQLPYIMVDQEKKPIVEKIFYDFLSHTPSPIILKNAQEKGLKNKGHGALKRIIMNPFYAGLVSVKAFQSETAKIVKGVHESIVPEDVFWKAYYQMQDQIRPQIKVIDPNLPLRGLMRCGTCDHPFTGSKSKGKYQHYDYYRCLKCNANFSAIKTHNDMQNVLSQLSLSQMFIKALQTEIDYQLEETLQERKDAIKRVGREYDQSKERLDALEEKHIMSKIEESTYWKWHPVYLKDVEEKSKLLGSLKETNEEKRTLFKTTLPYFTDIPVMFNGFTVEGKQALLKGIFPGSLYRDKNSYRTPFLNDLFIQNQLKVSALIQVEMEIKKPDFSPASPECPTWESNRTFWGNHSQIESLLKITAQLLKTA